MTNGEIKGIKEGLQKVPHLLGSAGMGVTLKAGALGLQPSTAGLLPRGGHLHSVGSVFKS